MAPEAAAGAGPAASAAPIVKSEEVEDGQAAGTAQTEEPPKAEDDEEVDYGGDAPAAQAAKPEPPPRAVPDYGDLVDGDGDEGAVKTEPGAAPGGSRAGPGGDRRPDALFVGGVQRLTRTHLDEIFQCKGLRSFVQVDWIADDQVIVEFASARDAASALAAVGDGFADIELEDDALPGPGLWRAQRGMLEFRQATTADQPAAGFQRKHRAGKQVREYRFWEAIKDVDRNILTYEVGDKRPMSSGEDCIAAASWGDPDDVPAPPPKRRRRGAGTDTDDDSLDLLRMMAKQDKTILVKEETLGEVPQVYETNLVGVRFDDEEDDRLDDGRKKGKSKGGYWRWEDDDSWWWEEGGRDRQGYGQASGSKRRRKGDKGGEKGGGKGDRNGGKARGAPTLDGALGDSRATAGATGATGPGRVDDEERARRQRRAERFAAA